MSIETLEIITLVAGATLVAGGTIGYITGLIGSALGFTAFLPIVLEHVFKLSRKELRSVL